MLQIFWQAQVPDGKIYTGGYSTYMQFMFKKTYTNGMSSFKISLTSKSQNIQPTNFKWYVISNLQYFFNIIK